MKLLRTVKEGCSGNNVGGSSVVLIFKAYLNVCMYNTVDIEYLNN